MVRKSGLGRGLDAILGDQIPPPVTAPAGVEAVAPAALVATNPGGAYEVPIEKVSPGRGQPRRQFDEDELDDLTASVKAKGIIQPLIVTESPAGYELIAGERRLRAAARAGLETVPIVVKRGLAAGELVELALIENIQRSDLSPLEEAKAYQRLIEEYGQTQAQVAQKVGKARATVTNSIRLLALPEPLKQAVDAGKLTEGHARALLGLATTALQVAAARKVMQRGLSVRETEALVRESGDRKTVARKPKRDDVSASARSSLEKTLQQALGTKVRIRGRGKGGRIEIDYFSHDELDRLLERIVAH